MLYVTVFEPARISVNTTEYRVQSEFLYFGFGVTAVRRTNDRIQKVPSVVGSGAVCTPNHVACSTDCFAAELFLKQGYYCLYGGSELPRPARIVEPFLTMC